ncbi:MAG: FAD-dependent oxidoreductase [Rhodovarius sp.]|nr:FAD-dependent oxidoreductase [Rhodovarius sp.]MCX7931744.1 FAD-dependent oxidoreductase [Rhodovarius sp.]MDW8313976.1 FAD-dependent oxidoreductase [Rhodovarius sp.]
MEQERPGIIVIGAGVVGLAVAWHLARGGVRVTILDPAAPASGASFGNAGAISGGSVAPLAMPGVLKQVPGMLRNPRGALRIPPAYLPRLLPWLARFVAAARPAEVERIAAALHALQGHALDVHRQMLAEEGASHLLRETGHLHLYFDAAHHAKDAAAFALRRRFGQRFEILEGAQLHAIQPGLSPRYRLGVLVHDQGFSTDPHAHALAFLRGAERRGARLLRARAQAIITEGGRVAGVATDGGPLPAAQVVLAAGVWSAALLRPFGYRIPLESQRGYHIHLPNPGIVLERPVVAADRKVFLTPMASGLRVAGTVEFGGLTRPPDPRRAAYLLEDVRRVFPAASTAGTEGFWMGHRPCLPDSLPVVGPVARVPGLWCAFGHGHLGLTGSAPTGAVLAQAMLGQRPNIDLSPFAPERFG